MRQLSIEKLICADLLPYNFSYWLKVGLGLAISIKYKAKAIVFLYDFHIIWISANAILVQLDDGAERLVEDVLNEPNLSAIIADQAPHPSNVSGYFCKIK